MPVAERWRFRQVADAALLSGNLSKKAAAAGASNRPVPRAKRARTDELSATLAALDMASGFGDSPDVSRVARYFDRLAREGFFGDVLVKWQGGRIVGVKQDRFYRVEELPK